MATSGGGDYEFVQSLPEELTCSICMKVLCEPHLVNCCGQQFCKGCLEKWQVRNKACPHCRGEDFSHMLMKQTKRKIGELKVYCSNKQHGCQAELKVSDYEGHLSTTNKEGCLYVKVACPNDCQNLVFRCGMKGHVEGECPKRSVVCPHCKLEGEHQFITGEHEGECTLHPLPCPHGCEAIVLRQDLETHRDTCPLEPVHCPFNDVGCKVKVCRKDLEKHIETNVTGHLTTLAKAHVKLQEDYFTLKGENDMLKKSTVALEQSHEGKLDILSGECEKLTAKCEELTKQIMCKKCREGYCMRHFTFNMSL